MQLADLVIEEVLSQTRGPLTRTYETTTDSAGLFTSAESHFEQKSLALAAEGWQLIRVSQRGNIVSPCLSIVATYER